MVFQTYTDEVFLQPVVALNPANRQQWSFETSAGRIFFRSTGPCATFRAEGANRFHINLCGSGEIAEAAAGSPMRIRFEGMGLPGNFGE